MQNNRLVGLVSGISDTTSDFPNKVVGFGIIGAIGFKHYWFENITISETSVGPFGFVGRKRGVVANVSRCESAIVFTHVTS